MKADIILADPAWKFETWSDRGQGRSPKYERAGVDQFCQLPVAELAADNCALFLWTTWTHIQDAVPLVEAWGFTFRTLAWEWVKLNKRWKKLFVPFMPEVDLQWLERLCSFGLGYYTRNCVEPCLLAVRGRMPVASRSERDVLLSPLRDHSQKPDEQYGKIERLYPAEKYPNRVELFARQEWLGWIALGNEVDGQDLNISIRRLIDE